MNRRGFLSLPFLAGSLALVSKVRAIASPSIPVLYGDGVHDDTFALNEWGAGRPVLFRGKKLGRRLEGGYFLVSDTINISRQDGVQVISNVFINPVAVNGNCLQLQNIYGLAA